ncbi:MAG: A/G-specific adenine glycosylase [Candidatus Aminicenantes bacterium]|nr:A/G-specific adenine glycosylase [Candidatus Aminicenantes bacterium]
MDRKEPDGSLPRKIGRWYRTHRRRLPWRETKDPYKIWVSEVMLQQTTVNAVIPYYVRWLELFPDIQALARAPLRRVLKAWEGLGYYQRARNLHQAARTICRKHGGSIPAEFEEFIALPGVGPYIAAAVLSLAFDKPYPVLDANVRRVGMRLYGFQGKANARADAVLLARIRGIFPVENGADFNQALMELGALICRPKNPGCLLCPVQSFCRAYQSGEQEVIPAPKSRSFQQIETVVGIISDQGKYLIQQRPAQGLLAGLWEFPGGKREKGETLREALRREIKEELGVEVRRERLLLKLRHAYTRFQVELFVFECELDRSPLPRSPNRRWVGLRALKRYPFPSGSAQIVRFLEDRDSEKQKRVSVGP